MKHFIEAGLHRRGIVSARAGGWQVEPPAALAAAQDAAVFKACAVSDAGG